MASRSRPPHRSRFTPRGGAAAGITILLAAEPAKAALTFTVEAGGWPDETRRNAAIAAMQSTVDRYNAYGDFGNHNVYVYYNAGIPTAQANYLGAIGFGATWPNERVAMHELAHYLGSGTYGDPWNGPRGEALVDQFDGLEASLNGDGAHFWPYGLNFDSEGAEINKQRQVALVYAQRADMGIGATAIAGATGVINLIASDPPGESGFNYATRWSDAHFAHPGAAYSSGNFLLRTPASGNSFTFVGESLRVNNTNGINGGLLYKGTGTTGVTTFKNLILDGGYVRHANGSGDHFRLAGNVTLAGSSTLDAAQGPVTISASIGGSGSLIKKGAYPLVLSGGNTYGGSTTISAGVLRLSPTSAVADYTFDNVSGGAVINDGTGGAGLNGTLANGANIVAGGRFGNAVSLASGASVDIASPIVNLSESGSWTVSAWVKTTAPGASILTKGDGAGWSSGNTIFYLGDGTAGGSGGIPSAVRWGGGFLQGSTSAASVHDDNWHQVTYVNSSGTYAIYVDGAPQALSPGNSSFANADVGTVVRLGVSTNTVAGDGTVNFNGLLDSVQFYNQALSATQIAALYQGHSAGPLPITTHVTIASGATLDVNGVTQQIASLSGPAGSAVTLGAGRLIVSAPSGDTQFAGAISGAGGSFVKAGASTLTLAGSNTYTGPTTANAGRLILASSLTNSASVNAAGGTIELTAGGGKVVKTPAVTVSAGGMIDVKDNAFITATPIGSWNGSVYTGVTGMIASAAIATTMPDATGQAPLTGLGVATAGELGRSTFAGLSVAPSDVLVMYTWAGDANLDGKINIDDYGRIDGSISTAGASGWFSGDFNYDGKINIDDYGVIDGNINRQGAPFSTAGSATSMALNDVAAVPEPAAISLLVLASLLNRRRRT